jgi:hypothetical protein
MRRKALWISLLAACAALPPVACATGARTQPHRGIAALWRDYQDMPPRRALALAGDPDNNWVAASSGGHTSQREAEQTVLAVCRGRRAARRMQAPCRLYASGDEIVWETSE